MTNARYLLASASIGTLLFAASAAHAQSSTTAPVADTAESEIVVTGIRGSLREAIDAKRDLSVIADVVTADPGRRRDCWQEFEAGLAAASKVDAVENPPQEAAEDDWIMAREQPAGWWGR